MRVSPDDVEFGIHATSWRDLTLAVGRVMARRKLCTSAYGAAMVRNVELNGPYLVIAPGVALLHARPDDGALRNGLVIGTCDPVRFGHSSNDPVWLFLGLVATGDLEHVAALQEIALTLSQPGMLDRLRAAGTPDEFAEILSQQSQRV